MSAERQNFIYFLQAGESGPVKIGRSLDVCRRFTDLRGGHAEKLRLLATIPGDVPLEAEMHQRFAAFRLNGEWFSPAPALMDFIATLPKDGSPAPPLQSIRAQLLKRQDFSGPPTVDEVLASTLRNLNSPESRRGYAIDWQNFCVWLRAQEIEVLKARPSLVRAYVAHMRERGLKRTSVARALSVIREVYAAFVVEELMEVNPAREVKNPRADHTPKAPWLNEEEARQLLAVTAETWREKRDRMCLHLLFGLGWRREEISRICVEDFEGAKVTGIMKGGKPLTVGVPEWLLNEIAVWREYAGIKAGTLLPRSEKNRRPISGIMVYNCVKDCANRVGLAPGKVTPHGIRRTKITLEGERGVSLRQRQLAVGHSNSAITERYDHARDAARGAPGQILADLLKPKASVEE